MNKLYITVESIYGPDLVIEFGPCTNEDIPARCQEAKEMAFEAYEKINTQVPAELLYSSIVVSSAASYLSNEEHALNIIIRKS